LNPDESVIGIVGYDFPENLSEVEAKIRLNPLAAHPIRQADINPLDKSIEMIMQRGVKSLEHILCHF
jgi:hypothetical protein